MTSPSIVRAATPDDEKEIWRLFRLAHRENAMFEMSEKKVGFYLERALYPQRLSAEDCGPRGIIGVVGPSNALEGIILLILGSPWFTEVVTLEDALNFVDPAHRRSNHAKALIGYAKHLTDGIRKVHKDFRMVVGVVSTKRTAAKIRLYSRQLVPCGSFFMYPPPEDFEPLLGPYRSA